MFYDKYRFKYELPVFILIVFFFFTAMVILGGIWYYKSQNNKLLSIKKAEIQTIGLLKEEEIVKWRNERLSDADVIYNNQPLIKEIASFFNDPSNQKTKEELIIWIQSLIKNFDYQGIILLDNSEKVRLSFPPSDTLIDKLAKSKIGDVYFNKVTFTDFHSSKLSPELHLDMLVPLMIKHDEVFGTVIMRIDPSVQLFRNLRNWPTPSISSETFLVKRAGDSIVYLNKLKYQGDTAINVKLSIKDKLLPAAQAASGQKGVVEGIDYRHERVIAFIKNIPGTDWSIVAKIDKKEILSPIINEIVMISLIVILLIALSFGRIRYFIRIQNIKHLKELQHLSEQHEEILESIPSIIMKVDNSNLIRWANRPAINFFGDNVLGSKLSDYFEGEQENFVQNKPSSYADSNRYYENWKRRKDGEKRLLSWWSKIILDEYKNPVGLVLTGNDITDLFTAEEELKKTANQLKELNATKDKFFSIIGHDLRAPFTTVIGFSELLCEGISINNISAIKVYSSAIREASWQAMTLLKNLKNGPVFIQVRLNSCPLNSICIKLLMKTGDCSKKLHQANP